MNSKEFYLSFIEIKTISLDFQAYSSCNTAANRHLTAPKDKHFSRNALIFRHLAARCPWISMKFYNFDEIVKDLAKWLPCNHNISSKCIARDYHEITDFSISWEFLLNSRDKEWEMPWNRRFHDESKIHAFLFIRNAIKIAFHEIKSALHSFC